MDAPDGIPTLTDVVVSGDSARRQGLRLDARFEPPPADATGQPWQAEAALAARIVATIRTSLPEAMVRAARAGDPPRG